MKFKLFLFLALPFCITSLSGCSSSFKKTNSANYDIAPLTGENEATDYSKDENWMFKQTEAKNSVDLLYFYPTVTLNPDYYVVSKITDDMRFGANYAFKDTASCFKEYTNVFAPYYTQVTVKPSPDSVLNEYAAKYGIDPKNLRGYSNLITYSHVRTDVYAALDYYFEHFNHGRPFMLAGHSQGSQVVQIILSEYMRVHPEFYSKMVVAYTGGFTITKSYLEANLHLKAATGETDTGVIVSWATEGPGATKGGFAIPEGSISINLLNWRTDEIYAPSLLNKGRLLQNHPLHTYAVVTIGEMPDCKVNLERGTLVTLFDDQKNYPYEEIDLIAGEKSYHTYDYSFYYMNLKENGLKRINAFLNR